MDAVTTPSGLTFIKRITAYYETLEAMARAAGDYEQAESAAGRPVKMAQTLDRQRRRIAAWEHVRRHV